MLTLRILRSGPLHGYAIAQRIHILSSEILHGHPQIMLPEVFQVEAMIAVLALLILSVVALHVLLVLTEAPPSFTAIPDWRILVFAFSITFLAAIFFRLTPALQIAR